MTTGCWRDRPSSWRISASSDLSFFRRGLTFGSGWRSEAGNDNRSASNATSSSGGAARTSKLSSFSSFAKTRLVMLAAATAPIFLAAGALAQVQETIPSVLSSGLYETTTLQTSVKLRDPANVPEPNLSPMRRAYRRSHGTAATLRCSIGSTY
jgi:hypothetical protein